jgi:hypothetical protein
MAVARVVMFEGVSSDRMDEVKRRMSEGEPPEGMPSSELIVLHDPGTEKSLVVGLFDNEDDYRRADEILSAMPAGDTPGSRTSVTKYDVAHRMKS